MQCEGCGNKHAARVRIGYSDGKKWEICDSCGASPVWMPDVYLEPGGGERRNENLCNDKGEPIPYSTKREKAAVMRMLNVREAGDRSRGYRNESHLRRKKYFT